MSDGLRSLNSPVHSGLSAVPGWEGAAGLRANLQQGCAGTSSSLQPWPARLSSDRSWHHLGPPPSSCSAPAQGTLALHSRMDLLSFTIHKLTLGWGRIQILPHPNSKIQSDVTENASPEIIHSSSNRSNLIISSGTQSSSSIRINMLMNVFSLGHYIL